MAYQSPNSKSNPQSSMMIRDPQSQPSDHLGLAIVVTVLCPPIGVVALMKSIEVRDRWDAGDLVGAESSSQKTKKWALFGLICGIIFYVIAAISLIAFILSITGSASGNSDGGVAPANAANEADESSISSI